MYNHLVFNLHRTTENPERRGTGPPGGEPERGNAGSTRTVSRKRPPPAEAAGRHTTGGEGGRVRSCCF